MTPSLAVLFSAAGDGREVKIDENCALISVVAAKNTGQCVVSTDPKTTIANTLTTPVSSTDENVLAASVGAVPVQLNIPLMQGSSIFVSAATAGAVVLNFQLIRLI